MSERLETVDELEGSSTRSVTGETVPAARGQGLDAGQVAARVEAGQVNDVPSRSSRSLGEIVRANLFTRINAIIGVLFVIILIVGPIQDALFGGVILANTVIGIIQEVRAKRTLDELAIVGETRPSVWRDGVLVSLSASEVVKDDVIELGPGDKIVVDGRVIGSDNLEIDESLLTGEADPVVKEPGDPVMSGSFVVAGTGAFATTRVGKDAYAAQLAEEAKRFTLVNSELRQGISTILKYVTYVIIPAGIALIISQLMINDGDLPEAIRRMVGGLVPMVPEGLVLLTSIAFAVGVVRLGKKQCLVQELPAIEGLARVDTVCLDKTGTLTEASMDVEGVHPVTSEGSGDPAATEARLAEVLGALGTSDERPNASMQAIIDRHPAPEGWTVEAAAPFSSARKWSGATLTDSTGDTRTWLLGAPDVLLPAGHPALADADAYGGQGLRVLLLARCSTPLDALLADPSAAPGAATPAALVVIKQRIRPEAPETLRYFADQGVDTKVISGDNALSVGAVARGLDLPGAEHPVDARALPDAEREPEALADKVEQNTIFGRVGPQQKRDMVTALQSRGHTVAMTGDGVNDVLALKDADIAVAMGSGSPASRGVAQIVLLNNNFSTLPSVVAEGRRVIGNIERVANLFLTKTVYSALLAIIVVLAQVPYPFLPRHLTLIGSLSIGIPAFFLALAPNKERARSNFVGRVLRFAIPAGALAAVATFSAYLMARGVYDNNLEAETSVACLTLFLVALWALAIISRPYTWWRLLLVGTMGFAFAVVLTVPFLQEFFQISLVGTRAPLTAVGIAVAAGATLEILWAYLRRQVTAD
ncbi:HAD-IC family P-type ATPase [Streptomyces durbertensis]|uniref:HAD-IC family P-type ATPase n=1 Tax=Streptomyces durbertensis TaxID=2448886 RepID=A0ABR6EH36_9ACTN|nr:HAD-IC family P-type ATPase [Streptomyces durbertensis]MBB1244644.1 HAD-IC family P-type ATPase [Streptomyces durbertensis]